MVDKNDDDVFEHYYSKLEDALKGSEGWPDSLIAKHLREKANELSPRVQKRTRVVKVTSQMLAEAVKNCLADGASVKRPWELRERVLERIKDGC